MNVVEFSARALKILTGKLTIEASYRVTSQTVRPPFFFSLVSVIRRCFGESYTAVPDRLIEKLAWRIPHDL